MSGLEIYSRITSKHCFSIFQKFIKIPINIKIYTAHPHDMVHVPGKSLENTAMRLQDTVRKQNVTDRQTGGTFQYLPSRAFGAVGDTNVQFLPPYIYTKFTS